MAPIVSEEYKRKKKKEILDSALYCFAKKGFQSATIDEIVAHSKISKGAIYNYFKSKEEIYLELVNEETAAMNQQLTEQIATFKTALEKLQYLFDLYMSNNPAHPDRIDSIVVHYEFRLFALRDERLQEVLKERSNTFFIQFISNILEEGKASGEFKSDIDSSVTANLFWAIIDGATFQGIANKHFPYMKVIERTNIMLLNTILSESHETTPMVSAVEDRENVDLFMNRIFLSLI